MRKQQWRVVLAGIAYTTALVLGWATLTGSLAGQSAAPARITVVVPADATVTFDGSPTAEKGTERTFLSPPLEAGYKYSYEIVARWTAAGKPVEKRRTVALASGGNVRIDFLRAEEGVAQQAGGGNARGGDASDKAAIARNAEMFVAAFHKGDARAVAALWAVDCDHIDQTGRHLKGREAIEKVFTNLFAENKGLKVRIESHSLQFVTPEVAVEDGTMEVFPPDGGPPSRGRFTNVHIKKNGQWLLGSVRAAPFVPSNNYQHLSGLEWAIGEWAGEAPEGGLERLAIAWSENQNFINATFSTTLKNVPLGSATHKIGWDPKATRIRSWVFDESGGFGEASWARNGKSWVVKTTSVLPDGKDAAATYILTPVDADSFTLEARDRSEDGNKLPDLKAVKMKRVK
jgi:uncharacterized protein (TIGR02246 family)